MANAEEQRAFEMVREHDMKIKDMESRLAALEDLADDKEGATKKTAAKRG